jgi:hypothetical protein
MFLLHGFRGVGIARPPSLGRLSGLFGLDLLRSFGLPAPAALRAPRGSASGRLGLPVFAMIVSFEGMDSWRMAPSGARPHARPNRAGASAGLESGTS